MLPRARLVDAACSAVVVAGRPAASRNERTGKTTVVEHPNGVRALHGAADIII